MKLGGSDKEAFQGRVKDAQQVGIVLVFLSLGAVAGGALIGTSWGAALGAVGGATLSVATVSFIWEPRRQRDFANEILAKVGVGQSLREAGLIEVLNPEKPLQLADRLQQSRSIRVLPENLGGFLHSDELRDLLNHSSDFGVELSIFVPVPQPPYTDVAEERFDETGIPAQLQTMAKDLADAWEESTRHTDSTLTIYEYPGVPTFGLVVSESIACIDLGPAVRYPKVERGRWRIVADRHLPLAGWAAKELSEESLGHLNEADKLPRPAPPEPRQIK